MYAYRNGHERKSTPNVPNNKQQMNSNLEFKLPIPAPQICKVLFSELSNPEKVRILI